MRKKIIVLGVNGMAGHVIFTGLKQNDKKHEVYGIARTDSIVKPSIIMDVSNFQALGTVINNIQPDIIINCVGVLNKSAEEHPDEAILLNAYLPHFLESVTKDTTSKVIHISTDCVFSGNEGAYTESSFKNGRGFYAQSKALGEIVNHKDLTFRTSIIGPELNLKGIGLFQWFSKQKENIFGYNKAIWTGITTIELLNAIKNVIDNDLTGLYHLVNEVKISKFELVSLLSKVFETSNNIISNDEYKVDKSLINTRVDFQFKVKKYDEMIYEMKEWILSHKEYYPHYTPFNF
jgi:dTDP-4-dehydrorhamnose reductase